MAPHNFQKVVLKKMGLNYSRLLSMKRKRPAPTIFLHHGLGGEE
jgi:hypothetical protein